MQRIKLALMVGTRQTLIRSTKRLPRPAALVSVVVPLFDEEANLAELHTRLTNTFENLYGDYELIYVDDGSQDSTSIMLSELVTRDSHCVAVQLSRNFGHQAAVTAGLDHALGDAVIVMDGDLQDPPEILPQFVEKWREGYDVVYAVRRKRKESIVKRLGYYGFYRLMRRVSDVDLPLDAGDFCLLDRKAVDALNRLPERVRFVRGLRRFVGFRQVGLEYERDRRAAGTPKYTFRKLIALAVDGLFNFSAFPLHAILAMGCASMAASVAAMAAAIGLQSTSAWLLCAVFGVGGLQLMSMSILGEYLRRVLMEVKGRPTYIVQEIHRHDSAEVRVA